MLAAFLYLFALIFRYEDGQSKLAEFMEESWQNFYGLEFIWGLLQLSFNIAVVFIVTPLKFMFGILYILSRLMLYNSAVRFFQEKFSNIVDHSDSFEQQVGGFLLLPISLPLMAVLGLTYLVLRLFCARSQADSTKEYLRELS